MGWFERPHGMRRLPDQGGRSDPGASRGKSHQSHPTKRRRVMLLPVCRPWQPVLGSLPGHTQFPGAKACWCASLIRKQVGPCNECWRTRARPPCRNSARTSRVSSTAGHRTAPRHKKGRALRTPGSRTVTLVDTDTRMSGGPIQYRSRSRLPVSPHRMSFSHLVERFPGSGSGSARLGH